MFIVYKNLDIRLLSLGFEMKEIKKKNFIKEASAFSLCIL